MSLLLMLVFGAIAGAVASYITHSSSGLLLDIVLGVVGAFVGSLLMNLFGQSGVTGIDIYSFIVAVVGAVVVIALYRGFTNRGYLHY